MPTYQYQCTECGSGLEAVQKFTDDALTECPQCHGRLRKVFSAVGVVFKGSGFYRTDSRASAGVSGASGAAKSTAGASGSASNGSGSSGGDSGAKTPSTSTSSSSSSGSPSGSSSSSGSASASPAA